MVLARQSVDVSKLLYHLRLNGDRLDDRILGRFDQHLRLSVETTLGGELADTSWWQATTGVKHGGLGLRTVRSTALAAFTASRLGARPLVRTMVDHFCAATGASHDAIMQAYDTRTEDGLVKLVGQLPPESALKLLDELRDQVQEAEARWMDTSTGAGGASSGGSASGRGWQVPPPHHHTHTPPPPPPPGRQGRQWQSEWAETEA